MRHVDRNRFDRNRIPRKENKRTGWPSHISGRFSLLFYDWISDSRESYRRREISSPPTKYSGIKKSVRGIEERSLAACLIYPCDLERRMLREGCLTNFTFFSPLSRPAAPTISYAKQPPGQVPFKCLRNRRFCPSSDEHHCLSICLSVYRIDIRERVVG